MHPESIDKRTKLVFEKIAKSGIISQFYLAGGTGLALHLGHRNSIDFDFFSNEKFSNSELKNGLAKLGDYTLSGEDEGTLHGVLDEVKISFFYYKYNQLYPFSDFEGIKIADERDIAAMKIDSISSRGNKRDFIDLYFLLEKYPLEEIISFFELKFSGITYNKLHILKSIVFFDNAEGDPMPMMLKKVDWEEVKRKIAKETRKMVL